MEKFTSIYGAVLASVASLILFSVVLRISNAFWLRPKRWEQHLRQQGIRGIRFKPFNLTGDTKEIVKAATEEAARPRPYSLDHRIAPRVGPFFYRMVQEYGKVCFGWTETRPRLIVAEPELMKLILTDKKSDFTKPPLSPLVDLLQLGVSTLEGQKWADRRKLISPFFHVEKLKGIVPAFSTSCSLLIDRWKKNSVADSGDEFFEIDVAAELLSLTGDVIARTAFGSSFEEGKRIFELQKEQVGLVLEAYQSIYLPGFRFLPTKKNRRQYYLDAQIKSTLRGIIAKKEKSILDGESRSEDDLLGLLLQCVGVDGSDLRIEDVIEECKLFYFAGAESTSNWLTWTLIVLSMHPKWQEKARDEVLRVCGDAVPTIEDINRLKIMTMILNEVLRLYPPVTGLFRHTTHNTNIGNISIPAGVDIYLSTLLIHHDPEYWGDDVEMFRPERFADGILGASRNQTAFFPFGWGPRICLGMNFATIEAKMALAMILRNFRFELSPSYVHAPCTVITLQPQYGAPLILHPIIRT